MTISTNSNTRPIRFAIALFFIVAFAGAVFACTSSLDCPYGQGCVGGQCICSSASQCPINNICVVPHCVIGCDAGTECMSSQCSNINSEGIGKCVCKDDSQCPSDQMCSGGVCVARSCPSGQTDCNRICTDTQTDSSNCGGCGAICSGDQICQSGACSCTSGVNCNGMCTNTQTDSSNCGSCGASCPGSQICTNGKCVAGPTGQSGFSGSCSGIFGSSQGVGQLSFTVDQNGAVTGTAVFKGSASFTGKVTGSTLTASLPQGSMSGTGQPHSFSGTSTGGDFGSASFFAACSGGVCNSPGSQSFTGSYSGYFIQSNGQAGSLSFSITGNSASGSVDTPGGTVSFQGVLSGTGWSGQCANRECTINAVGYPYSFTGSFTVTGSSGNWIAVCSGTVGCSSGQTSCSAGCTDIETDPSNCGACGTVCPTGSPTCTNGQCTLPLPTCNVGLTLCGVSCINTLADNSNCGACGKLCSSKQICSNGVCTANSCAPRTPNLCNGTCTNISGDLKNCGACGNVCSSGQTCNRGNCVPTNSCTNGVCVSCTTAAQCQPSQICESGTCACPADESLCNGKCQSLCGGINGVCCAPGSECNSKGKCIPIPTSCPSNEYLCSGTCQSTPCACSPGLNLCSTGCVNESNDPSNCGGCTNVCPSGLCNSGMCSPVVCNKQGYTISCGTLCCPTGSTCGANNQCNPLVPPPSCPSSDLTLCSNNGKEACVNKSNDQNNCGGCGIQCPSGSVCQASICYPYSNGLSCTADSQCASGFCNPSVGKCALKNCITDSGCPSNQYCDTTLSVCEPSSSISGGSNAPAEVNSLEFPSQIVSEISSKTTAPFISSLFGTSKLRVEATSNCVRGAACASSDDCCGAECANSTCVCSTTVCVTTSDCCTGYCSEGKCRLPPTTDLFFLSALSKNINLQMGCSGLIDECAPGDTNCISICDGMSLLLLFVAVAFGAYCWKRFNHPAAGLLAAFATVIIGLITYPFVGIILGVVMFAVLLSKVW